MLYMRIVGELAYKENEFFPGLPSGAASFLGLFFLLPETDLPSYKAHPLHHNFTEILLPPVLYWGGGEMFGEACLSGEVHA